MAIPKPSVRVVAELLLCRGPGDRYRARIVFENCGLGFYCTLRCTHLHKSRAKASECGRRIRRRIERALEAV